MSVWARTMFRVLSTVIGAIALLAPATPLHAGEAVTRSFHMGFTPAEYDVTSAARADLYAFIGRHADLIAHHFAEGVPWPEAFERRPYQASFEENLRYRVFHPDFMAYGLEVNGLIKKAPRKWPKFLTLARQVTRR